MGKVRRAIAYSKRKPVVNTRFSKRQQYSFVKAVPPIILGFPPSKIGTYPAGFPIPVAAILSS